MTRVLFVLKHREIKGGDYSSWGDGTSYYQLLHSGLFNSARFVNDMLNTIGIESKLVHVVDNNKIHAEIVKYKPDFVVIEAYWVVPEKFDELRRVCPNVKFIVRNHSEAPFLANEGIAFDWTLKYIEKPNVIMSCNSLRMLKEVRFLTKQKFPHWTDAQVAHVVPYLPNYYPIFPDDDHRIRKNAPFINVGCFGAVRPLKNHVAQAIAAMMAANRLGKRLNFHINGGRLEGRGEPILKNIVSIFNHYPQHNLINHPWRPHSEFKEVVRKMDVVSQVTFSETFNIVAADAVSCGVPLVASKEIGWSNPAFHADPTDTTDIANQIVHAYNTKKLFPWHNPSLGGLKKYNRDSVRIWGKYFTDFGE